MKRGNYGVSIGVGGRPFEIDFRFVPDGPKYAKYRLHLDVKPVNRDQEAELSRLLALGARQADVGQGDGTGSSWPTPKATTSAYAVLDGMRRNERDHRPAAHQRQRGMASDVHPGGALHRHVAGADGALG